MKQEYLSFLFCFALLLLQHHPAQQINCCLTAKKWLHHIYKASCTVSTVEKLTIGAQSNLAKGRITVWSPVALENASARHVYWAGEQHDDEMMSRFVEHIINGPQMHCQSAEQVGLLGTLEWASTSSEKFPFPWRIWITIQYMFSWAHKSLPRKLHLQNLPPAICTLRVKETVQNIHQNEI